MAQANPYPLRIEKTLMEKFKVVAAENGRSVNKEIEFLVKKAVQAFEKENGVISLSTLSEEDE